MNPEKLTPRQVGKILADAQEQALFLRLARGQAQGVRAKNRIQAKLNVRQAIVARCQELLKTPEDGK